MNPLVFAYAVPIPMALGIVMAAFLIFPVVERVTNAKQVQMMTGLSPTLFWATNILWDLIIFTFSVTLMLAITFALDSMKIFITSFTAGK